MRKIGYFSVEASKLSYGGRSGHGYGRGRRKSNKWFHATGSLSGWHKDSSELARHSALNKSIANKGLLRTYDSLLGLANVTQDQETERVARKDYEWISKEHADGLERARKQTR